MMSNRIDGNLSRKARILTALMVAIGLLLGREAAAQNVNHYIVLFDASGSMKRDHRAPYNFWQGRSDDNPFMAQQLSRLVRKALREPPPGFPPFSDSDLLSFMMFRLEYGSPSYLPQHMFMSNKELLIHVGLPSPDAFVTFEYQRVTGVRGFRPVSEAFGGFSPLVAATAAALPFVGQRVAEGRYRVSRTFMIRITDGSYNANANGADEHAVILRHIDSENRNGAAIPYPQYYADYRDLAEKAGRAFDIGIRSKDCVLVTHRVENPIGKPFDCGDRAFDSIKQAGTGLMLSYIEVEPRRPSLHALVQMEKQTVDLERVVEEGAIWYVGRNSLLAPGSFSEFGGLYPVAAECKLGEEGEWQACLLEETGQVECGRSGPEIHLSKERGEVRLDDNGMDLLDQLRYRVRYEQNFGGSGRLYPFVYGLEPIELTVRLRVSPASLESENLYYPPPPSALSSLPPWLDPRRLLSRAAYEPKPQAITDEVLLKAATRQGSQACDTSGLTPQRLASESLAARERYLGQETNHDLTAKVFYGGAALSILLVIAFWPYRKLRSIPRRLTQGSLLLDFNKREHDERASEPPLLVGMLQVRNEAWALNNKSFTLTIAITDSKIFLSGDDRRERIPLECEASKSLISVVTERTTRFVDKHAVKDKTYPVFFDPRAIMDCDLPARSGGHELCISFRSEMSSRGQETQYLDHVFDLSLRPERERLMETSRNVTSRQIDGHRAVITTYKAGESEYEVCGYTLENTTRHRYSLPAEGTLRVCAWRTDGTPLEDTVYLKVSGAPPAERVSYGLRHGEEVRADVVVDFGRLDNPIDEDCYRVGIFKSILDGAQSPGEISQPGEGERLLDDWLLVVARATDRTSVSMNVITSADQADGHERSPVLNENRATLHETFVVGDSENPVPVKTSADVTAAAALFQLRLANACRDGRGFARWHCRLENISAVGLNLDEQALRISDEEGADRTGGELLDSPEESQRVRVLTVELLTDHPGVEILRQHMQLSLAVEVAWEVYEDGEHRIENMRSFATRMDVLCHLKHVPPDYFLAVDFGTSAVAIAHAIGSRTDLLPLQQQLRSLDGDDATNRRRLSGGEDSPFLSSECSVCARDEVLKELTPDSRNFLDLPLLEDTVFNCPEKVILSLKALVSAGFEELPFSPKHHPYRGENGGLETARSPLLHMVIEGAYRGLMDKYIRPILEEQERKGFSHVVITYPNTYTPNHVKRLSELMERVFVGSPDIPAPHVIYPDNIHLLSESDAVAYYYFAHAWDLRGRDWSRFPDRERILIYDIGAGTLDLTHLEVEWQTDDNGRKVPRAIKIRNRAGANRAGNLLDECIARDLHESLEKELDGKLYVNPIVAPANRAMDPDTCYTMDRLRQTIHRLKTQLSENGGRANGDAGPGNGGERLRMLLADDGVRKPMVRNRDSKKNAAQLYAGCTSVQGTELNEVFWTPTREQILQGRYVKAFFQQVAEEEILRFFKGSIPQLDTVIISGRTSLWPGFEERLKATLGDRKGRKVPNWVSFNQDSAELKKAVVLGALERRLRYWDVALEDPGIIGDFVVAYEPSGSGAWEYCVFRKSGESHELNLGHASEFKVGICTTNGFIECFSFASREHVAQNRKLKITLSYNRREYSLHVVLKAGRGHPKIYKAPMRTFTLPYKDRPWPLGMRKLAPLDPEDVMKATQFSSSGLDCR